MTQTWEKRGNLARPEARGSAAVGSMSTGASKDLVITLDRTLPTAGYSAVPTAYGSAAQLAAFRVLGVISQTTTAVTVRVTASGTLATGASVHVIALV